MSRNNRPLVETQVTCSVLTFTPANENSKKNDKLKSIRGMDESTFTEPPTPFSVKKLRTSRLASDSFQHAEFKEVENQCRRLVVQRSHLLKDIACKDEELKKITFKQQSLMKIKTNLQSTIAKLEKELKELRKSNDILKAKNGVLENTGMKKSIIQVDLANARGLLASKDHDIADLKSEISNLKTELKNVREKENSALKLSSYKQVAENAAASEELENLRTYQEELLTQHDLKAKRILELQSEFHYTQEQYASSLECSESLQSYKDTLNDRVSLLKGHNFELENLCDSYLGTVNTLEHQIGVLSEEKKSTEEMLYDAHKDADSLRQELVAYKDFETKMNADKLKLENDADELRKKMTEEQTRHLDDLESLNVCLSSTKTALEVCQNTNREQLESLDNLQRMIEQHRAELELLGEERENLRKTNLENVERHREELKSLSEERENLRKTNDENCRRFRAELESFEKTNEVIAREKEILETKIGELNEINRALEEENWAKSETIDEGKNLIAELERVTRNKDEESKKIRQNVEDLKWQLQEASENCVNLREKFGDLESMFTARENEANVLNTRNGELFKLLKDKDEMLTETYEKMRKVEDELVEKHLTFESLLAKTRDLEDSLDAEITANNRKEQLFNGVNEERNFLIEKAKELREKVLAREREIDRTNEKLDALTKDNCSLEEEISELKNTNASNERRINELTKHSNDIQSVQHEFTRRVLDLESRLSREQAAIVELEKENEEARALSEKSAVRSQQLEKQAMENEEKLHEMFKMKSELDKMVDSCTQQQKCIAEQRREICEIRDSNVWMRNELDKYKANLEWYENRKDRLLQDLSAAEERLKSEIESKTKWQKRFVDLRAKVEPFQEQLDMFEAEKNALLCDNTDAQKEVNKMSKQYAALLGHQNQKQKIHHVIKLKEENLDLKKEVSKSREHNLKLQKKVERLESQLNAGKRRFDPSKAFSHTDKENHPLHDTNC